MNHTFQSIRVGIFFVLGIVLIYSVYAVIGSGRFAGDDGYLIEAGFDNVRTLTPGADVRMAGVRIGAVESTELRDGRGYLELKILPEVQIPANSVARISMASLLGQNYISVEYRDSEGFLNSGDEILSEESGDLNSIMRQIEQLGERLNGLADAFPDFGESGMGDLFGNLNDLVTENRERFDTVMLNLEELTVKLNEGGGTLGKLINEDDLYSELMTVVQDFKGASEDMGEALGGVRTLMAKVEAGEGTLGRLLVSDDIALELEASVRNLREFSDKLNSGEGTLGKLVTDESLYNELRSMLNKADSALDSMGDAGPITAVGAVSGALF